MDGSLYEKRVLDKICMFCEFLIIHAELRMFHMRFSQLHTGPVRVYDVYSYAEKLTTKIPEENQKARKNTKRSRNIPISAGASPERSNASLERNKWLRLAFEKFQDLFLSSFSKNADFGYAQTRPLEIS